MLLHVHDAVGYGLSTNTMKGCFLLCVSTETLNRMDTEFWCFAAKQVEHTLVQGCIAMSLCL